MEHFVTCLRLPSSLQNITGDPLACRIRLEVPGPQASSAVSIHQYHGLWGDEDALEDEDKDELCFAVFVFCANTPPPPRTVLRSSPSKHP